MKYIIFVIMFSWCVMPLNAFKNIEISKKKIIDTLQKNNPTSLATFNQFCSKYDQLVIDFFDSKNNLSLAHHVKRMQRDLVIFNDAAHDEKFAAVQPILIELNHELEALVTVLKQYTHSKNSVGLAFKVRRFKKLLPSPINKWTEFSLFWSLNHRLSC